MKKLLLSLAFATALTAPALAGDIRVNNSLELDQIGVNNAAITIQNVSGDDIEINADSFKNIDTALDLGDLEIQNVNYVIGDHSEIEGVQNINDDIEDGSTVMNGGIDVEIEDVTIDARLENNTLALGL